MPTKSAAVKLASLYASSAGPCSDAAAADAPGSSDESDASWLRKSRHRVKVRAPASSAFCSSSLKTAVPSG
jgi:hypothetical protein